MSSRNDEIVLEVQPKEQAKWEAVDDVLFVPQTYWSLHNAIFQGLKFREKGEVSIADSLGFFVFVQKSLVGELKFLCYFCHMFSCL